MNRYQLREMTDLIPEQEEYFFLMDHRQGTDTNLLGMWATHTMDNDKPAVFVFLDQDSAEMALLAFAAQHGGTNYQVVPGDSFYLWNLIELFQAFAVSADGVHFSIVDLRQDITRN